MRRISKRVFALLVLLFGFAGGLVLLAVNFSLHGAQWAGHSANGHIYSNGAVARAGAILDRNGAVLAESKDGKRRYPDSATLRSATLHVVGDPEGFIAAGAHSAFRSILSGYSAVNGVFDLVRYGKGRDVVLSIDSSLCKTAYQALDGRMGTVGVYNYQTGEVLCMVSSPSYDPLHKPKDINNEKKYEAVYLNRFLQGVFTPGSTFKVVTAACALENMPELETRSFTCTGRFATGAGYVTCRAKHGKLGFEEALNVSCNSVFAQLGVELGEDRLRKTAEQMGFNQSYRASGIPLAASVFQKGEMNALELGWASIGQHTTLANPCQMLILMGAIANGGQGIAPRLLLESRSPSGSVKAEGAKPKTAVEMNSETAARLRELLRSNVTNTYDPSGSRTGSLQLCGKTGTAEVDGETPHAWFIGFSRNPQTPYAIVVVGENAGSGQEVAFKIAAKVMRAAAG
ncbi:MAG: penicillin-binding protein [Oscillospiraceae bacterium]|nr:penicillin-binding protein [Oscillospiraceae bacterium]